MLSEREKDQLLGSLPGMAYRCSVLPPWPMEYVSEGVRFLCSFSPQDFVSGKVLWGDLLHPEDATVSTDIVGNAVAAREQFTLAYRIIDPKLGDRWVLERGEAVYDADGEAQALIGFIVDISDQKMAENKLRRLQSELIHISGETAMGTMAATLAHELNQPLAASANYLTGAIRMVEGLEGDAKVQARQGLEEARQQILRAGEIIRRMRDTVSRQPGARETTSLKRLMGRVTKVLEASRSSPELVVRTRIGSDADQVLADPIQIEQALLNLIRNAADASSGSERKEVLINSQADGDQLVKIQVRDWGRGIPDSDMKTLFDGFGISTTGGLGVGLSITRTIVEAHGGRIWAENNADVGASFIFTVPVAPTVG